MATGTVKFFDEAKGWGFIVPDDGGGDLYVHWKSCGNYVPRQGDIVQFDVKEFDDGRRAARHVDMAE